MSIVPISRLSPCELSSLGNNIIPPVKSPRRRHRQVRAVNRSLAAIDEAVGRLYRRSLNSDDWSRAVAIVQ